MTTPRVIGVGAVRNRSHLSQVTATVCHKVVVGTCAWHRTSNTGHRTGRTCGTRITRSTRRASWSGVTRWTGRTGVIRHASRTLWTCRTSRAWVTCRSGRPCWTRNCTGRTFRPRRTSYTSRAIRASWTCGTGGTCRTNPSLSSAQFVGFPCKSR